MAAGALVSVEEYLSTDYSPDVEYVDGFLVERNVGEWQHGLVQSNIIFALRRKYPGIKVIPELRSKGNRDSVQVTRCLRYLERSAHTRAHGSAVYCDRNPL